MCDRKACVVCSDLHRAALARRPRGRYAIQGAIAKNLRKANLDMLYLNMVREECAQSNRIDAEMLAMTGRILTVRK
jgi:hypothetical protein